MKYMKKPIKIILLCSLVITGKALAKEMTYQELVKQFENEMIEQEEQTKAAARNMALMMRAYGEAAKNIRKRKEAQIGKQFIDAYYEKLANAMALRFPDGKDYFWKKSTVTVHLDAKGQLLRSDCTGDKGLCEAAKRSLVGVKFPPMNSIIKGHLLRTRGGLSIPFSLEPTPEIAAKLAIAKKKFAAEKAAAAKAAAEKRAAAGYVDDLFGDLSPSKPASRRRDSTMQSTSRNGASGADVSNYAGQIKAAIESRFYDASSYTGKSCTLRVKLAPDGTLLDVKSEGGDPALCRAATRATMEAKMPKPPSKAVYEIFKNAPMDFKP